MRKERGKTPCVAVEERGFRGVREKGELREEGRGCRGVEEGKWLEEGRRGSGF